MSSALRLLLLGGLTSYRALFQWLSPWILIPAFLLGPLFQIMFFAYLGQAAGVGDNRLFLIGNAVQYAAIPCLFAMGATIAGERRQSTLPLLLVSPARRVPLFLGRALPVILNGFVVSIVALALGALLLRVSLPASTWLPLALVVALSAVSCTGLGLATAALALRVREMAVTTNIFFGLLLIFAGVNVPLALLPGWMAATAQWLPLTHGIAAARALAGGASLSGLWPGLAAEAGLAVLYATLGLGLLAWFERESRRRATLAAF